MPRRFGSPCTLSRSYDGVSERFVSIGTEPMRILVYGFGPYRRFRDNVTEKILRRLPRRRGLRKMVFPVRFHHGQFVQAVRKHRPDVILGLGQCSKGKKLRTESRALNRRRNDKSEKAKPILRGGPRQLSTNLRLGLGLPARSSRNAGDYVCNYSMYVILDYVKGRRPPVRFGFVHIPHDFNTGRASLILAKAIDRIEAASIRR
jgi:pyroglutamyl-peptidase